MSIMQRLTLIGLYNFDDKLFDNMSLPEGYDKDTLIETLLLEHGEKCVLYTDPDFMKYSIGVVSRKWQSELHRIYEALTAEYNPIWNYDRNEEWDDKNDKTWGEKTDANYDSLRTPNLTELDTVNLHDNETVNLTDKRTANLKEKTDHNSTDTTSQTTDGTTERQVAAFNSSSYEPSEKTIANNGTSKLTRGGDDTTSTTGTDEIKHSGTDNTAHTGTDTKSTTGTDNTKVSGTLADKDGKEHEERGHKAHLWGNIGVTTSAAMVTEETQLRFKYNLYGTAAQIFANELLINIY